MDVSQPYGSMIGTLCLASESRWRACSTHEAGTNKRFLLPLSSTPTRTKSKKRGSRSGVQVKRRRAAARLGSAILGHGERARCLHRIPLLNVCDRTSTLPSAWATTEVLEPSQRWSGGQWLSSPPRSSVFTPVLPAWSSWSPRDCWTCLRPVPLHSADTASVTSSTLHIGLLNARSIANKSFSLNDLCVFRRHGRERKSLSILMNFVQLAALLSGSPAPVVVGGGLAVLYRDSCTCKVIQTQEFTSFAALQPLA